MAAGNYPFVSTWGKQGLTTSGAFTFPQYAAVDETGNVYVTDLGNSRVQKFDNDGSYLHSWGSMGSGSKEFHSIAGIAVKNNYVYVVDHDLNSVKKFDISGNFIKSWNSGGTDATKLKLPNDIAVSKDNSVYVVDTGNSRVLKFDSDGKFLLTIGSSGTGDGQFLTPLGIATDGSGNVYVSDSGNNKIDKFTSDGAFVKKFTASSGGIKISPDGLAIDSSGNIIVADTPNNRVVVLDSDGKTVTTFGKTGTGNSQFKMVKDVTLDSDGDLFVVDSSNHRIQKFGSADPIMNNTVQTTQTQTTQTQTTQTQAVKQIVGDTKKPTINPPKDIYVEATGGLTPVSLGKAAANDESGIKSLTNNAPLEFPLGITTVIWTAIDGSGNMGMATQTVTVGDSTPPVINALSDIVSEAQGAQNPVDLGNPTVTDSVGVMSITNDAPESFPLGETIVTWTAIDVAKNEATATQLVTIIDTKAPKIKAPAAITAEASSFDQTQVNLGEPVVTDNSEISSITNDAPEFFHLGETIVTWTAADIAGNVATSTQKVTIIDTSAPIIAPLSDITAEAVSALTPVDLVLPNATDVQPITFTNDAPESFPIGQTKITWTAFDSSGNNSTATQTVSVVDTTAPVLTVPENITQEATGSTGNIVALGQPITQDISEVSSVINNAPSDYPFGSTMVTWTATDKYGNSASGNQNVTIIDTTKPSLSAPADVTVEATSITQNVVTLGEPQVSDLVGVESVTSDSPESFPLGQTTITWTARDTSGNVETATQIISVVDTVAPQIILPQDITQEATGPNGTEISVGQATANDVIGVESLTNDSPNVFNLGLTQVTWTAKDSSGNISTAIQNVTITDTTAPTIVAPSDVTAEATSATDNTVSLLTPEVRDIVSQVTVTNDAPESFPLGETIVTWTATDESGNIATVPQKVVIVDTTAPTITTPSDITLEATSKSDNTVLLETPVATDNVGMSSVTNDAPDTFQVGETIVTWTATDSSGLISTVQQKINVVDTTIPIISVSDITLEATSEHDNSVDLGNVKADDLVEIISLTSDAPQVFSLGVTTITWTATDSSGNTATATQKITITDTTMPSIIAPSDITLEAASSDGNIVSLGDATASDAVLVSSVTNDAPEKFPLGETTVTWTATDSSGNTATATQKITITDTTMPSIIAPSDITLEAASSDGNIVSLGDATASDAVLVSSVTNDAPEKFPLGETTVTWTATDSSGNTATAVQKITVIDTTAPTIATPSDITLEATSKSDNVVLLETPIATDSVGVANITNDAPELFPVGETLVTWTASDASENVNTVTQKVIVVDTVPPKFAKLSDVTVEATSNDNNLVSLMVPQVSDILDIISLTNDAPEKFPLGETTVTWTATDESGNASTATQKVSVIDTTIPTIMAPADVTMEATSASDNVVQLGNAQASDAVMVSSVTNDAPEKFPLGETTVTWTATDSSGNQSTITQKVTIIDTTAPKITAIDSIVSEATSLADNIVSLTAPVADDSVSQVKITNDAPEKFPLGETTVTWTATDESGNASTAAQKVVIVDTTAPKLSIPDNIVIDAVSLTTLVTVGTPSVTDLTDITPKVTNDAPESFPLGKTTIIWTAVDSFGNEISQTQTVEVNACGKPESSYNVMIGKEIDDILVGTGLADLIIGLGGDDIIFGEKGNDCILAGDGDDIVYGNEGSDSVNGADGSDVVKGQSGDDILIGGNGVDVIDGGDDNDSCSTTQNSEDDVIIKCES
ncbi:HYR domain-containing protein [Candidatus Nitrosotenuis sp. DW1]|uniref:HYR domain-containing protein n=1 Tax=Candidatus Nitrosotenuis sp. DW1 TaxID=2259672 RepID=UPI0015CBB410|nr:HYR domain-containing protein [Candidatus Nitrosotenuis sp. DW1]